MAQVSHARPSAGGDQSQAKRLCGGQEEIPGEVGRLVVSIEEFDLIDLNLYYDYNRLRQEPASAA